MAREAEHHNPRLCEGEDTGNVDLVLVCNINAQLLDGYVAKFEEMISRRVRTLIPSEEAFAINRDARRAETAILALW